MKNNIDNTLPPQKHNKKLPWWSKILITGILLALVGSIITASNLFSLLNNTTYRTHVAQSITSNNTHVFNNVTDLHELHINVPTSITITASPDDDIHLIAQQQLYTYNTNRDGAVLTIEKSTSVSEKIHENVKRLIVQLADISPKPLQLEIPTSWEGTLTVRAKAINFHDFEAPHVSLNINDQDSPGLYINDVTFDKTKLNDIAITSRANLKFNNLTTHTFNIQASQVMGRNLESDGVYVLSEANVYLLNVNANKSEVTSKYAHVIYDALGALDNYAVHLETQYALDSHIEDAPSSYATLKSFNDYLKLNNLSTAIIDEDALNTFTNREEYRRYQTLKNVNGKDEFLDPDKLHDLMALSQLNSDDLQDIQKALKEFESSTPFSAEQLSAYIQQHLPSKFDNTIAHALIDAFKNYPGITDVDDLIEALSSKNSVHDHLQKPLEFNHDAPNASKSITLHSSDGVACLTFHENKAVYSAFSKDSNQAAYENSAPALRAYIEYQFASRAPYFSFPVFNMNGKLTVYASPAIEDFMKHFTDPTFKEFLHEHNYTDDDDSLEGRLDFMRKDAKRVGRTSVLSCDGTILKQRITDALKE